VTRTDLRLSSCAVVVRDLDAALGFYRDVLGLRIRHDHGSGRRRRVSVGPPAQPEVRILLELPGANPRIPPADRQALTDLTADGVLGRLVFATDDCDAIFEHIEAAGAEVMQEPIDQPDGVRDCAFVDPCGNIVRFAQPRRTTPLLEAATTRRDNGNGPRNR
jgi:predicted enzyme related to lactoylglutathione lyase